MNKKFLKFQKIPETIAKVDRPQTEELPNASNLLDLLTSFQEMRTEEQKLLGIKQHLLTTQQDLYIKLAKEIDKKKETIANLTLEIPNLQNKCHQIGEVTRSRYLQIAQCLVQTEK